MRTAEKSPKPPFLSLIVGYRKDKKNKGEEKKKKEKKFLSLPQRPGILALKTIDRFDKGGTMGGQTVGREWLESRVRGALKISFVFVRAISFAGGTRANDA